MRSSRHSKPRRALEPADRRAKRILGKRSALKVTSLPVKLEDDGKVRLNRFLASAGICSRRAADELIGQGRVSVNGEVIKKLGLRVDPTADEVRFDGSRVQMERKVYLLFNKPRGVVCTNARNEQRRRVIDYLPEVRGRVYTVGRLDAESEGLILLTNDGDFAQLVAHPRHGIPKTYAVLVKGRIGKEEAHKARGGVWLSEGKTGGARIIVQRLGREKSYLKVVLREGRNREVRRIFAKLGYPVISLKRIRIGDLNPHGLGAGKHRYLTKASAAAHSCGQAGCRVKLAGVKALRLDNGFRALLVERHNLPVVATVLWYEVGARDERSGETGLSHFLEHMMFKGTASYAKGEIDLLTSKMGGRNNAFTDSDSTAYHFSLAADRWQTALHIEADRMRSCLLDEEEFEAEKQVVLEELAMGEDDPWHMLFEAVEVAAYQVHPYHHPVIGWRQDLERLEVARMRSYYQRHYGANRAFLVVAGDFDAAETRKLVTELFAAQPCAEPRAEVLNEPSGADERRIVIHAPGRIARLCVACRTCRMGQPDDFALDLIGSVLGSGKSSRLHDRLVTREQLATTVTVWNETRLDPGLFWVAAELHPGVDPEAVEAVIREELLRLVDKGPSAAELRRARTLIRSAYLFEEETVLDIALRIARFEALAKGGHGLLRRALATYEEVGQQQIRDVARRYFACESWAVAWSLPAKSDQQARR